MRPKALRKLGAAHFPLTRPMWPSSVPRPPKRRRVGLEYDTTWSRRYPARLVRAILTDNVTVPLTRFVAPAIIEGGSALERMQGPVIIASNHASHADTGVLIAALPLHLRHKVVVAAASDYFFDTPLKATMASLVLGAIPIERTKVSRRSAASALELLAAVGGFTALFGSLVMITQTSVKRTLAFSTVAQMGFMMLQCGLGAFALALLHIAAHSLYKAHAFLSSGSVVAAARRAGTAPARRYRGLPGAFAAFAVAAALVVLVSRLAGSSLWEDSGRFGLALILMVALSQLLWHWWSTSSGFAGFFSGIVVAAGLALLSLGLHEGARHLLGSSVAPAPAFTMAWPIAMITALSFLLLALRAFLPPTWASTAAGRILFVHAYNGFYVNTAANRLVASLWPPRPGKS